MSLNLPLSYMTLQWSFLVIVLICHVQLKSVLLRTCFIWHEEWQKFKSLVQRSQVVIQRYRVLLPSGGMIVGLCLKYQLALIWSWTQKWPTPIGSLPLHFIHRNCIMLVHTIHGYGWLWPRTIPPSHPGIDLELNLGSSALKICTVFLLSIVNIYKAAFTPSLCQ